ncbi:ionotropic receptor 25a-like isoform X2 [Neocloeon triangulifer]|uniref:ionotropic receptor 25a-like isoform X2 n=1 Tax=Neocloeon triangulifer TaxID=2078957 RepID=UPI00286F8392|nr:ionotropic receptor 25a-like isoform X2 [Neocloeon triangulifer]
MRVFNLVIFFGVLLAVEGYDLGAPVTYLMLIDKTQQVIPQDFESKLRDLQFFNTDKHDLILRSIIYDARVPEGSFRKACQTLITPFNAIFDFTLGGWPKIKELTSYTGTPYLQVELTNGPFFLTVIEYVQSLKTQKAAFIFQTEIDMISAEYALGDEYNLEVLYFVGLNEDSKSFMKSSLDSDNVIVIFHDSNKVTEIYNQVIELKSVAPENVIVCLLDFEMSDAKTDLATLGLNLPDGAVTLIKPSMAQMCCPLMSERSNFNCDCSSKTKILPKHQALEYDWDKKILGYQTVLEVVMVKKVPLNETNNSRRSKRQANKNNYGLQTHLNQVVAPPGPSAETPKKIYVVAYADDEPWSYRDGNVWLGYCVDLMQKMADMMKISFNVIRINEYGSKQSDGSFNGVIGQVIKGDVDIVAAPFVVTSELDDVVNFVEPYFERIGLSIATMIPQISKSLFKFATVLSPAVWISTFGVLGAMSVVIYLFEVFSPFSYRNDPARYPFPCRVFNFYESVWFASTSFTPQGGGECPRPLSVRVVIFGYWIFVVLMLATFTSNLAAFLTVERAQNTLDSLESMARQTRVAYAVQKGGRAYRYFDNMRNAEDLLYKQWVDKVEAATGTDVNTYRTWNYPIREMYKIVWEQLNRNGAAGLLDTPAEGIRRVLAKPDGSFAFIHDSPWIKYEVLQDCRLTEIGDIFGEQPVAFATQSGADDLAKSLTEKLLILQRDRYLEELLAKHWNQSLRANCDGDTKTEGISLESIGGIFIFTFGGLGMAFFIVLLEVLYQQRVMARAKKTTRAMFPPPNKIKRKKKSSIDLLANKNGSNENLQTDKKVKNKSK